METNAFNLTRRALHDESRPTSPSVPGQPSTISPVQVTEGEQVVQLQNQGRSLEQASTSDAEQRMVERNIEPFPIGEEYFKTPETFPSFPTMNFSKPAKYNTCFASSALHFLGRMLDDGYLNRLNGAGERWQQNPENSGCPPRLLEGVQRQENRNEIIQSWLCFRELFCEAMVMLRQPQEGTEIIPESFLNEFFKRMRRLGEVSAHSQTLALLGKVKAPSEVKQTDVSEFLRILNELLGLTDVKYGWKGVVNLQDDQRVVVGEFGDGQKVYAEMRKDSAEPSLFYTVPLPYNGEKDTSHYFNKCLAPTVAKEPQVLDEQKVQAAFSDFAAKNPAYSGEVEEKLRTSDIKRVYPLETGTNIFLKPDCDSISICLNVTARESDMGPGYYDLAIENEGKLPEKFSYDGIHQQAMYMRDKTTDRNYVVKVVPIGGLEATEGESRQHAQASQLGRKFYDVAGIKTLRNSTVTKIYAGKTPKILSVTEDPVKKTGKPAARPDCRADKVSQVLNSQDWQGKEHIVFDAWLGNLDIVNGRSGGLGVSRVAFHSADLPDQRLGESHELTRTEFECFGYKHQKAQKEFFDGSAVGDLKVLLHSNLFKAAGITREELEYGQRLLKKMTDDVIEKTVRDSGVADKSTLITVLKSRRDSIINVSFGNESEIDSAVASIDEAAPSHKFSLKSDSRKLTRRSVRALASSKGIICLPVNEISENGEIRSACFKGTAKSIVCHAGPSLSEGHYITLQRYHDSWFVLDDCLSADGKPAGMVPVQVYTHMFSQDYKSSTSPPNGFDDIIALLRTSGGELAPFLVGYERDKEGAGEQFQRREDYERQVVEKYRSTHPQYFPGQENRQEEMAPVRKDEEKMGDTSVIVEEAEMMDVEHKPVVNKSIFHTSQEDNNATQKVSSVTVEPITDTNKVSVEPVTDTNKVSVEPLIIQNNEMAPSQPSVSQTVTTPALITGAGPITPVHPVATASVPAAVVDNAQQAGASSTAASVQVGEVGVSSDSGIGRRRTRELSDQGRIDQIEHMLSLYKYRRFQ